VLLERGLDLGILQEEGVELAIRGRRWLRHGRPSDQVDERAGRIERRRHEPRRERLQLRLAGAAERRVIEEVVSIDKGVDAACVG
jgi:hypothetical protein